MMTWGFSAQPEAVKSIFWLVFGVLCLMSVGLMPLLKKINPQRNYVGSDVRLLMWWVVLILTGLLLGFNTTFAMVVLGFVSFLALKEFLSLIPVRRVDYAVLGWAYLAIPIQYYWIGIGWYGMFIIFVPVYMFLLLPMRMVFVKTEATNPPGFLRSASVLHWAMMSTVFCLGHLGMLLMLPQSLTPTVHLVNGATLLIYLLVLTQVNDLVQYLVSKLLPKKPMFAQFLVEKSLGGLFVSFCVMLIVAFGLSSYLTPLNWWQALIIGGLVWLASLVGEVVMHAIKQDLGVDHKTHILTGQGGILERLDSLTFAAPVFFHFIYYLHYPKF